MAYSTPQRIINRFGMAEMITLSNQGTPGIRELNLVALNAALESATSEINGYLGRYTLPFLDTPQILIDISEDLARYKMDDGRREPIRNRYLERISFLRDLAKGITSLGLSSVDGMPSDSPASTIQSTNGPPIFSRQSLDRFTNPRPWYQR